MDEGWLSVLLVVGVAGAAGAVVVLTLGAIQLGRPRLGWPRRRRRRPRLSPEPLPQTDAGDRLAFDVEGILDLVRTDRLSASGRPEIEALTIAETLLDRALERYRGAFVPLPAPRSARQSTGAAVGRNEPAPAPN